MLQELYNKQKKTLAANLATKNKSKMGETYSKFPGLINPPVHSFQQTFFHHITEVSNQFNENIIENILVCCVKWHPLVWFLGLLNVLH
jgi:hypothetical protein